MFQSHKRMRRDMESSKRMRMSQPRSLKRKLGTGYTSATRKRVRSEITPSKRRRLLGRQLKRSRAPLDIKYYGGDRKRTVLTTPAYDQWRSSRSSKVMRPTKVMYRLV